MSERTALLVKELAELLENQKLVVSCAESCTGGLIAAAFTDIAGSSRWFHESFVTYSNSAKHNRLGVSQETLDQYGAVSRSVVEQMVTGVLNQTHADIAVAVSGVAGPDGGSDDKPVGTVWLAWSVLGSAPLSECQLFSGDRESVRRQTVERALQGLIQLVEKNTV